MHADPHPILLIGEQVDIVIARPDGSQLHLGLLLERILNIPAGVIPVEDLMLHLL